MAKTTAYAYLPTITKADAESLSRVVREYEAGLAGSTDNQIERMLTKMALLYPNGKLSDAESAARLELYIELLRDIPFDILSRAFRSVAQVSKFFPTVAEIRKFASKELSDRMRKVLAINSLLMKAERESEPEVEQWATPEKVQQIVSEAYAGLTVKGGITDD